MNHVIKKEILDLAGQSLTVNSQVRLGQAVYNAAMDLYPKQTAMLCATTYDPFYDDERIDVFIAQLIKLVDEQ